MKNVVIECPKHGDFIQKAKETSEPKDAQSAEKRWCKKSLSKISNIVSMSCYRHNVKTKEVEMAIIVKSSIKLNKGFDTCAAMVKSQDERIREMEIKFLFAGTEKNDPT